MTGRFALILGGLLSVCTLQAHAQQSPSGTEIISIPSDALPPPSAEEVVPKTPFFTEPTTGNEVFEAVQELKSRVDKLEGASGVINQKADGTLVIEAQGPIEIRSPSTIKLDAKSIEMPKK